MSYKKNGTGEVLASKDFARMPQKMRGGWVGSQEVPTHRLVEPKRKKKSDPIVWTGEIEKIPVVVPEVEDEQEDDDDQTDPDA